MTQMHRRIFAIFYGSEEQDPERAVESNLNAHSYQASQEWVGDIRFARYIAPDDDSFDDEIHRPDLPFGDDIRLHWYWTSNTSVLRGEYLLVGMFWQAIDTPPSRYKVFLQLYWTRMAAWWRSAIANRPAARGRRLAGKPASTYPDNHALLIPEDLPAGDYTLIVGLYDINDPSARLPVGESTYVELGKVTVAAAS